MAYTPANTPKTNLIGPLPKNPSQGFRHVGATIIEGHTRTVDMPCMSNNSILTGYAVEGRMQHRRPAIGIIRAEFDPSLKSGNSPMHGRRARSLGTE